MPRTSRALNLLTILLALLWLGVIKHYPPTAIAQSPAEMERHIDNTDGEITKLREIVEDDHTKLAVLTGTTSMLETIGGAILLAAIGNFAISWKSKRP